MKNKILSTLIAAALLTLTAAPAIFALDEVKNELSASEAAADARFIDAAFRCNLAEIKAGEIVREKSTHDDVKDFADMLVKEHTELNKNLKVLADKMKIELPKDPGAANQLWLQKIVTASAKDIDRVYIYAMVNDHRAVVTLFEDFSRTTKNGDLKAFADSTLAGLRAHLEKSLEMKKSPFGR